MLIRVHLDEDDGLIRDPIFDERHADGLADGLLRILTESRVFRQQLLELVDDDVFVRVLAEASVGRPQTLDHNHRQLVLPTPRLTFEYGADSQEYND